MTQITLSEVFSHKHHPYPFYARLREEAPLARFAWGGGETWLATTYDDVIAILKDPRFVLDGQKFESVEGEQGSQGENVARYTPLARSRHLLNTDPFDHTRLRTLVSKAFTPRMIEQLRPRIQRIMDDLLGAVQEQGEMDLIADLAFPLPIIVICELLGIPPGDRMLFRAWTQTIVQSQGAVSGQEAGVAAEEAFITYIKRLITGKRSHMDDSLTGRLVQVEEKGDAPLARMEGQIAIGTLLSRLPHLSLAHNPEQLVWKEGGSLRNLAALPVTF